MTKASKSTKASSKTKQAEPAPAPATEQRADGTKMGKTQLVEQLAARTSLNKRQAAEVFDAMGDLIVEALRSGKTVGVPGLGTFAVKATAERQGVRPGTSERITIPAGKKVSFKAASTLKGTL